MTSQAQCCYRWQARHREVFMPACCCACTCRGFQLSSSACECALVHPTTSACCLATPGRHRLVLHVCVKHARLPNLYVVSFLMCFSCADRMRRSARCHTRFVALGGLAVSHRIQVMLVTFHSHCCTWFVHASTAKCCYRHNCAWDGHALLQA